ncbi:MAG: hypothetical protein LBN39_04535, partial [Planctomycetaceae bacterium]|nr:hypothetical protein [Planctomycetaceae bacterium]
MKKSALSNRKLHLESLESREMLSVNPLGIDNDAPAVYSAEVPQVAAMIASYNAHDLAVYNKLISQGWSDWDFQWSGGYLSTISTGDRTITGTLDVSGCIALTRLDCSENQLTSINASGCTALTILKCDKDQLTSLNASGCTSLTELDCSENQLT